MKKLILSLIMATTIANGVFAQNEEKKTSFGVKAELNSNFYLSSDNPLVSKTSNGFGANAGVFMKSNITNNLAFQVELLGREVTSRKRIPGMGKSGIERRFFKSSSVFICICLFRGWLMSWFCIK